VVTNELGRINKYEKEAVTTVPKAIQKGLFADISINMPITLKVWKERLDQPTTTREEVEERP